MEKLVTLDILQEMSNTLSRMESEMIYINQILIKKVGGLSIIGLDGRYQKVNDRYANLCGYVPAELVGQEWIKTVLPEDLPIAIKCYEEMVLHGEAKAEFRGLRKDGTTFMKDIVLVSKHNIMLELDGHFCMLDEKIIT